MASALHVFDYLTAALTNECPSVCVLYGNEPFLKQLARTRWIQSILGTKTDETPVSLLAGETTLWRDLLEELSTLSLFGGSGSKRVVVLQDGDKFVSNYRAELEAYVVKPRRSSTLILEVDTWPANTKLFKAVEQQGCMIDCRPPEIARGKNKVPDEKRIQDWLRAWGASRYEIQLDQRAAQILLELVGAVFGMLDQDLAKLALYVAPGGKVTADMVRDIVGGWRAKTAFEMIDAAVEGQTAEALLQLERMLQSGDHPLAVFGAIAWSLRRYHAAVRIYESAERAGKRITLREALQGAGFYDWPQGAMEAAERRLKQLTRERAGKLVRWLLDLDLSLKGSHSQPERARLAIETLFFKLSNQLPKAVAAR